MAVSPEILAWTAAAALAVGLATLSWIDLKTGYLPDALQALLAVAGVGLALIGSPVGVGWRLALSGAIVNGGVFWSLRWVVSRLKQREAMGLGDVKLVAVGGLWLGPWALPLIMAVGGLGTLLGAGIASAVVRRPLWRGEMPLGPGLAVGILGCFVGALCQVSWIQLHGPFAG
jgi:leader peptidase (prepilin peptidase)/N-methyltransferase